MFAYIYGSYGILIYLLVYFLGYIMVAVEMVLESLT
jgi:hypothetical protein